MIDWNILKKRANDEYPFELDFKIDGHDISVAKKYAGMSFHFEIYIDGFLNFKFDEEEKDIKELKKKVWQKTSKAKYTAKEKRKLIRIFGKKRLKDEYPDIEDVYTHFSPIYKSPITLINTFKKIQNIKETL